MSLTRATSVIYLGAVTLGHSPGSVPCLAPRQPSGSFPSNMDRKRILLYALAFVAFVVLVYMQFRTWRDFDWATFWRESGNLGKPPHIYHLFHAVALIYLAYGMRALRWKIFLRPVRPGRHPGSWLRPP